MRVAVFAGSASGASPRFREVAGELGRGLARAGVGIVYGGGHVGLMGAVADACLAAGGEVIGVMPRSLVEREIAHRGLTDLQVTETMHERKAAMAAQADAFVALPGGAGTLEELFEVWTWQHLAIHTKPVAVLEVDGFWRPLLDALDTMTAHGFLKPVLRSTLLVAHDSASLLAETAAWQPPAPKWEGGLDPVVRP
ncbi:TIGR00730 family Rossman fold protein [Streptomyces sp. SID3343]|uniref:LOG family protein n=1 Tax=Streptomyces sp. SID3343 TaxID=2690260 RepID=UPI0013713788|nr:TIGR00730 family Rossman fold protein [Streptomyces sp. SID3343]MYW05869.1 TIGR00730 family Rossman fold protein [Streptomyces sp. SID3343]